MDPLAQEILLFWLGTTDLTAEMERRDIWFRSTPEFDHYLTTTYTEIHERAVGGGLDHLKHTNAECLSLIIALDQFPRNIFRRSPRSFGGDAKAREIAHHALDQGYDRGLHKWPRTFFYLPFEHSEHLADQERGVELYGSLDDERSLASAEAHCAAVRRFGRFPHRNAVLGRHSTAEELEYLKDPPLWGKTAAEVAALENAKAAGNG
jgi:uncharacterized protein (DUF924 family)